MRMVDIIDRKRHGHALSKEEISHWIGQMDKGVIPDYQTASLLMAICWQGMRPEETAELTMAMAESGDIVDLSAIPGIKVDKHSTGGVGDTTTLIVAPAVAACGVPVAKMSGRGLGHTGGTLDKLESVPGVNVERDVDEMISMVRKNGIAVVGQSGNLVPADKRLYALRDVTATVDSIPLIASSIMSKKIAGGSDAIVLDVKTGSGAFMRDKEDAFKLGELMVQIGNAVGRRTVAIVTDMSQPLGTHIGNALEVKEAIDALQGKLPASDPLMKVCALLAREMLMLGGICDGPEQGEALFFKAVADGSAMEKLKTLFANLGADMRAFDNFDDLIKVKQKVDVVAGTSGYLTSIEASEVGRAAQMLGAGRAEKEDTIDPAVGLVMHKRVGDPVQAGEALATLYVNDDHKLTEVIEIMEKALTVCEKKNEMPPMIYGMVNDQGIQRFSE